MNLLLINHYAGAPAYGMEFRPHLLAREWVRQGHGVRIVAASYSHVRARQPVVARETIDGIEYFWLPTLAYAGNGVGRFRNIMAFLSQVATTVPRWQSDWVPQAVITSSTYPMDTWVGQRIARAAKAVLVHEIHDLWPLSPIELSGMSPWHPFALICGSAEKSAYRTSDAVVSMLPRVHEHVQSRGLDLKRLHIVPNGIHPDDWRGDPPEPLRADVAEVIAAARQRQAVVVAYAGAMGEPNALDVLLDAAAKLKDRPMQFVLVGDGHLREAHAGRIAAEGLAQVALLRPVPKAQVRALLAAADIAYIGWRKRPIYRFGIAPNKLLDYMAAGKPVLHSVTAANDPVADAGCGISVPAEDAEAIARGLRQLAALAPKDRRALGERGRGFAQKHHAWPVLAKRFLGVIEQARVARGLA